QARALAAGKAREARAIARARGRHAHRRRAGLLGPARRRHARGAGKGARDARASSQMMDPFAAVTLKVGLLVGLPVLAIGVCSHVLMPRRTVMLLCLLVAVEIGLLTAVVFREFARQHTGLEFVVVPGLSAGVVLANLLAIPIARWLRSLFNAGARR